MKWRAIYKIIPVPVFYVDPFKDGFAGKSNGFFVRIDKNYKDDKGLLEHELQHCRQFYRTLMLHGLFYNFSKKYRYKAEIECYKIQIACYDESRHDYLIDKFSNFLATKYNLNLDVEKVKQDLMSP